MKLQFYRSNTPDDSSMKVLRLANNPIDLNSQGAAGLVLAQAHAASLGSAIKLTKKSKGFIKIKTKTQSSYIGHSQSKSQQLLHKPTTLKGNFMIGDIIETVTPDTKHPNNTSGLAAGNQQNMQLLQKQKIKNSKTGKLIILKSTKTGTLKQSSSQDFETVPNISTQKYIHPFHNTSNVYSTLDPKSHQPKNQSIEQSTSLINLQIQGSPPALNPAKANHNSSKKMVSFEQQQPTMEQLEMNRRQNSQRQVIVKKKDSIKGNRKQRRQRDHGPLIGKTGSLFSYSMSQSNLSAPTAPPGAFQSLKKGSSTTIIGTKQQTVGKGLVLTKPFAKTKSQGFFKQAQLTSSEFMPKKKQSNSNEKINFNKTTGALGFSQQMQQRSVTQSPMRAIIAPMKQQKPPQGKPNLKFKPPLHNKRQNFPIISNDNQEQIQQSVEDFIKLADEGISQNNQLLQNSAAENLQQSPLPPQLQSIDSRQEQQQKQLQQTNSAQQLPSGAQIQPVRPQQLRSNFNLSFNNSFNTSYGNQRPTAPDMPQFQVAQGNQGSPAHTTPIISQQVENTPIQQNNITQLTRVGEQNSSMNFQLSVRDEGANESMVKDVAGIITKDAVILEQNLSNRLQGLTDSSDPTRKQREKIQAFGQTFEEVIEQDKPFGSLLMKIKQAYDDYLVQLTREQAQDAEPAPQAPIPITEEPNKLQSVVDQQELEIKKMHLKQSEELLNFRNQEIHLKKENSEQIYQIKQQYEEEIQKLKEALGKSEKVCVGLQQQIDKSNKFAQSKQQEIKNLTLVLSQKEQENAAFQFQIEQIQNKQGIDAFTQTEELQENLLMKKVDPKVKDKSVINMSLSISEQNSAPRAEVKALEKSMSAPPQISQETIPQMNQETNQEIQNENKRLMEELEHLRRENKHLHHQCAKMEDHINYKDLREKKIMYLVHLLQNQGYPVARIYDAELKQVHTERIQEFLDKKEQEAIDMEFGGPELDEKYHFSFHTDDSFEAIDDGPMLAPMRPECVPPLDLDDLPAYETSSDEDQDEYREDEFDHDDRESNTQSRGTAQNSAQNSNKQMSSAQYRQSLQQISNFYNRQLSHTTSNGEGLQTKSDEEEDDIRNLPPSNINKIQAEVHVNQKEHQDNQGWDKF